MIPRTRHDNYDRPGRGGFPSDTASDGGGAAQVLERSPRAWPWRQTDGGGCSPRHIRLLLAVAVAIMASSSVAEARHWRYHWHYHHGFYQAADEGQGQENTLRPVSNHQSRIEVDSFGRGIEQMISACAGQAVELKRIPFDLVSQTVQANDKQRGALERVRSTANNAAETLSDACPKNTPAGLGQRFDQLAAPSTPSRLRSPLSDRRWRASTMCSTTSKRRASSP